jgi:hypothetical protein
MPIHRESHPVDVDLKPGTTKSDVVVFLYRNLEFAYTPREIAEALDVPRGTATTTLRRLHQEGYVGRIEDGYYHGLDDREDLRRYPRSVAETEAMFASHPDAETAPTPDPERPADTVDDETLESELAELEEDGVE